MKQRLSIFLILAAALWLFAACSADDSQQDDMEDARIQLRAVTRAASSEVEYGDIRVLLTCPAQSTETDGWFRYQKVGDENIWTAQDLKLKTTPLRYNLYGYMPAYDNLSGSIGVNADGDSILTITGISPLTDQDICFVSGVKKSSTQENTLTPGYFGFDYNNTSRLTYLNLQFEHLLGRLVFKIKTGTDYYNLRRIKLKEVSIETKSAKTVSAAINLSLLKDNSGNVANVAYTITNATPITKKVLWTGTDYDDDYFLSTTASGSVGSVNVAVGGVVNDQYELVCTYDVYDIKDNAPGQLLSTRIARNKLSSLPTVGEERTLTLTVEPTYLYQLSDNDLDNPTVKLNIED